MGQLEEGEEEKAMAFVCKLADRFNKRQAEPADKKSGKEAGMSSTGDESGSMQTS